MEVMMKMAIAMGLLGTAAFFLGACSADTAPEERRETTSNLSSSCLSKIKDPVGSPAWKKAFNACLAEDNGGAAGGGGKSCSSSISCVNGSCTCGGGANKGAACDGTKKTGADSCSVLCSTCSDNGGGAPAPAPGPAPAPDPNDDDGAGGDDGAGNGGQQGCGVSVSCVNGSCTCGSGANKGAACDGAKATGADSCSVLCSSC